MKLIQNSYLLMLIICAFNGMGQTIAGYSFKNYRVDSFSKYKKAKINYESHKIAKLYKTAITEGYELGEVNFAGHYITIFWGCGAGCQDGAMVDVIDGNVYKIPIGESKYYFGCSLAEDEDCVNFFKNSCLFVSMVCIQSKNNESTDLQNREYFINVWNESKKKFEFIKSVKENKIVKAD